MIVKSQFKVWRWKFQRNHTYMLPFSVGDETLLINSSARNPLVVAKDERLTINRHYHFDGATWAPDFKRVLRAAGLHDALLQLKDKYPGKITEAQIHTAFRDEMRLSKFTLWPVYSFFTRPFFRGIYNALKR